MKSLERLVNDPRFRLIAPTFAIFGVIANMTDWATTVWFLSLGMQEGSPLGLLLLKLGGIWLLTLCKVAFSAILLLVWHRTKWRKLHPSVYLFALVILVFVLYVFAFATLHNLGAILGVLTYF